MQMNLHNWIRKGLTVAAWSLAGLCLASPVAAQTVGGNPPPQDPANPNREPIIIDVSPPQEGTKDPLAAQDDLLDLTTNFNRGPDQKVVVRERFAGWKQANLLDRDVNIGPELRSNWIMLSPAGRLDGQVLAAADADVANVQLVLLHRGKVVHRTRTDEFGTFSFENVNGSTYSLVGIGENAFFAFGFDAIEYRESTADKMSRSITVMAVQNRTTINLDWIRYFAPSTQFRVFGRFDSREGTEDPVELYGLDGLGTHAPAAFNSTAIQFHPARLADGGRLVGRLHQMDELNGRPVDVRGMRVMLLQNDDVAAAVTADNYGVFQFEGIVPGQYALVAVGSDGMACIGIEALAGSMSAPGGNQESLEAIDSLIGSENAAAAALEVVDVALISPDAVGWLNHTATELAYDRVVNRPLPSTDDSTPPFPCDPRCLYRTQNSGLRQFWGMINSYFDLAFYGETTGTYGTNGYGPPLNCAGCGIYGANGCYGGGMMPGCNQCGGMGCAECYQAPAPCGSMGSGCGNPNCLECHPTLESQPVPMNQVIPPAPTPAYEPGPAALTKPLPNTNPLSHRPFGAPTKR